MDTETQEEVKDMGTMEKMFIAFGTVNHITVDFTPSERETVRQALERAERYMEEMDDRLSVFKEDSEISQINRHAGLCDIQVSEDTFTLLRLCRQYGNQTGGVFDITTKPLTDAGEPPTAARVNYRDVLLDAKHRSVRLRHRGQGVQLGGIAKGYATDKIAVMFRASGVRSAVINLGGTVRHIGPSRRTGVRNPFSPGEVAVTFDSAGEVIVTSGLYERGSHIYDPSTGQPAAADLVSATVVGDNGAAADAAATACIVLGTQKSVGLLSAFGLEGILIRKDGGIFATKGMQARITLGTVQK